MLWTLKKYIFKKTLINYDFNLFYVFTTNTNHFKQRITDKLIFTKSSTYALYSHYIGHNTCKKWTGSVLLSVIWINQGQSMVFGNFCLLFCWKNIIPDSQMFTDLFIKSNILICCKNVFIILQGSNICMNITKFYTWQK